MRVGQKKREVWPGGYVRTGKKRRTFIIEKWIRGTHFHVSTMCSSLRAAMKQLERFEEDPHGYDPRGDVATVQINKDRCDRFRRWMLEEKGNTSEWTSTVLRFLADWQEDLGPDHDLRRLSLQKDLKAALRTRTTSQRHRIEAIKVFCTWLRTEVGELTKAEDRTLDLMVPQADPAQILRARAVSKEHVLAVLPKLPEETRDVMTLQLGTAWHISEVRRFAGAGELLVVAGGNPLAVLVVRHKSGDLHRTPIVAPEHLEAAKRIKARGRIPIKETLADHLRDACEAIRTEERKAGVRKEDRMPHFRLGVMRHSVLTWAVEMGATPAQASEFAGHRSLTTTKRFYLNVAVPTVSVPVLRLVKP